MNQDNHNNPALDEAKKRMEQGQSFIDKIEKKAENALQGKPTDEIPVGPLSGPRNELERKKLMKDLKKGGDSNDEQ